MLSVDTGGAAVYARSLDLLAVPDFAIASSGAENDVPAGGSLAAESSAVHAGSVTPSVGSAQLPDRPALSIVPLELLPAESPPSGVKPQRVRRIFLAAGLAVLAASGIGSVAYLSSPGDPVAAVAAPSSSIPAAPAAPSPAAPVPGGTAAAADAGEGSPGGSGNAHDAVTARTVPIAAPAKKTGGATDSPTKSAPTPNSAAPAPAGAAPAPVPGGTTPGGTSPGGDGGPTPSPKGNPPASSGAAT